jgi:hypothetical protein
MTDPVETPKRLYRKAARGKDESAALIVLSGVTLAIAIVVAVLTTAVLLVYFLV